MKQNETNMLLKVAPNFCCKTCDYNTSKKSSFNKHIITLKHTSRLNETLLKPEVAKSCPINFLCNTCNSIFISRTTLWRHKKKCNNEVPDKEVKEELDVPDKQLIMELLKSNNELQKQMIELCKEKNTVTNNNNTNCNNTNNQFNLQFFLNETCKDALNIDEFVNQIQLQLSDLDMIGKVGYVEGITKIFLRNLKALDVCKRPIHCSDLKREVLYIKDKGSWEKDNDQNVKIKRVIKGIEDKNIKQLPQWRAENPTHEDTETKKHMEYVHILIESMGGTPIEDDNKRLEK